MAKSGTKLVMKFDTAAGQKTWSYDYVNPTSSSNNLKAVADAIITNGSIYQYPPLALVSMELQTTSITRISV